MPPDPDPADLTPADRTAAFAALLAAGVIRLRDRAALSAPEKPEISPPNDLASSPEKSVTVHAG